MDIEKVFKAIYAQGYRAGIEQGRRDMSENHPREAPRHCMSFDFEDSKAKVLAQDLEKMLKTD